MITKEDIEYIKYVYDNRQRYIKPDVKRIIKMYNEVMPDGKHIFRPVNENICACNLRPYLIQLYRKMQEQDMFNEESTGQPHKKKAGKKSSK